MLDSPDMLSVIAQCGGIWKNSIIQGLTNPKAFHQWMRRNGYVIPLMKRYKSAGEWTYRVPNKFLERYWRVVPKEINEYTIFRSFALLLYYEKETNLPLKSKDFERYVGEFSRRPFNGVYYTIDEELHPIVIIVDYYRPVKKIIEMIGALRLPMRLDRSPYFHILTNKEPIGLQNDIEKKYEYEQLQVFYFEKLKAGLL